MVGSLFSEAEEITPAGRRGVLGQDRPDIDLRVDERRYVYLDAAEMDRLTSLSGSSASSTASRARSRPAEHRRRHPIVVREPRWNVAAQTGPSLTRTGAPLTRACTRTLGPVRVMRGARMKTQRRPAKGDAASPSAAPRTSRSACHALR